MRNFTIRCGCGRTMSADGRRGRGAYRCGCGATLTVVASAETNSACSVPNCSGSTVTGAEIRLCLTHKDRAVMLLAPEIGRHHLAELGRQHEEGAFTWKTPVIPVYGQVIASTEQPVIVTHLPLQGQHDPVVYFLRNGDRIKIGYTTNLKARLAALSLRPHNVMLLLQGGRGLESDLHRKYRAHRIGNTEWFHAADELLAYLEAHPQTGRRTPALRSTAPPRPA